MGSLFKRKKGISKENKFIRRQNNKITFSDQTAGKIHDSTEIEQVKTELKRKEILFRQLVENASDALYKMTIPEGIYEYFSPSVEYVFGYDQKEWYKSPKLIREIIHPDFRDYYKEKWTDLLNGIVDKEYEYKIVDKQQKERWIKQSNFGLFDEKGKIIAIEGICRNVTEIKKIEEELIRSKKIAEKYLDVAGGIILSLDRNGNIILLNKMGCEILGYSHDEIIGRNWFELCLKPEIVPEIKEVFSKIMKGEVNRVKYYENEIVTKSGKKRTIAWNNTVVMDDDGNIMELLSSGMDISDLSKYQDELKKAKETLEDEVEKKTEELRLRVSELERFFDATVERELRMKELYDEIEVLKGENKILVEQAGQKKGGMDGG